jgi:hypothetical protein
MANDEMMAVSLGDLSEDAEQVALLLSGVAHFVRVRNKEQFTQYASSILQVKETIKTFNESVEAGRICRKKYMKLVTDDWLNGVAKAFIEKYGRSLVPLDIRMAIDEVSSNVGVTIVQEWPEIKYVRIKLENIRYRGAAPAYS